MDKMDGQERREEERWRVRKKERKGVDKKKKKGRRTAGILRGSVNSCWL